jgi:CBS domain-containing protein
MEQLSLDGEVLAHQPHEEELDFFKARGLIVDKNSAAGLDTDKVKYFYIRHKIGPGQSDDAALVVGGLLYNADVALGIFLTDAIDTLEKYVPEYREQDSGLSVYVKENYPALDGTLEQLYELTYLSSIPQGLEDMVPDSSLRYFLTIDEKTGQTAMETHFNFIEGKPYFPVAVSFKRIPASDFYKYIKSRILTAKRPLPVAMPSEFVIKGLERSISSVMKKKFIVVGPDVPIQEALNKLLDRHGELVIIQDENKNILGIMDPTDFLTFLQEGDVNA